MSKNIYRFEAMTTPCEIQILDTQKGKSDKIVNLILSEAKRLEKKFNFYDEKSLLSKINKRITTQVDMETKEILNRSLQYCEATHGIFDITIGTIKHLYKNEVNKIELERKKKELLRYVGKENFKIKKNHIAFSNSYTKLDLGGIVKEYAVDRCARILKQHKISSALVNFGGDIYAVGKKPSGKKFSIGIKDPKKPTIFACYVELEDEALTTSASYERFFQIEDVTYSHIINTKNETKGANSASVISSNCVESGIYSTSLMIDRSINTTNKVIML